MRRDAHGLPRGPELAVRHGAGRQRSLRRQHRCAWCASPIRRAQTEITGAGDKLTDLPGGADQPSLDQEPDRQPRRLQALRDRRLQQQRRRERHRRARTGRAAILEIDRATGPVARLRLRPAQPERPGLAAAVRRAVDRRQRARRARQRPGARLHDLGQGRRRSTAGRTATTASTSTTASSRSGPIWWPRRIAPDYALGAHTASLGLAFYDGDALPDALPRTAPSSASTARGTARRAAATR